MTLVVVHTRPIGQEKKKRIEEAIVTALKKEGFPESQAMLLFQEGTITPQEGGDARPAPEARAFPGGVSPEFKTRARRTQAELAALKSQVTDLLRTRGTITSLQARQMLDLRDCSWAPPTLRRIFNDLEREGLVVQQGFKRNTSYTWKGPKDRQP